MQISNRTDYEVFVAHLFHLCANIGIRPAARALGIPEERAKKIAQRRGFGISKLRKADTRALSNPNALKFPNSPQAIEATNNIVQHYGDRAKISATIAGAKAMEHLADTNSADLVKPANAIAADQWTKAVDRAAGWTQARQQGVTVNVANIVPPTDAERAERKAVHAQLDAITALLQDSP